MDNWIKSCFVCCQILLFSCSVSAQFDTSRLASFIDVMIAEANGDPLGVAPLVYSKDDGFNFDNIGEVILNTIHQIVRNHQKNILSKKEYLHYKRIEFKIDDSKFSKLTMFEYDENKKQILLNKDMYIRLSNYCFLDVIETVNFNEYKHLNQLYSELLQHMQDKNVGFDLINISSIDRSSEFGQAVEANMMMNIMINLLFIEMHELYHIVYGNTHLSSGLPEEILADSFALEKVYNFFKRPIDQELIDKYSHLGLRPPTDSGILSGLVQTGLSFRMIKDYYSAKPHLFSNTINDFVQRGKSLIKGMYRLTCSESDDSEMCQDLKNTIDSVVDVIGIDEFTALRLKIVDNLPLSEIIDSCNEAEIIFKIKFLLFDGKYSEVGDFLETIVREHKLHVSEELYEISRIILLNIYRKNYDYAKIDYLLGSTYVRYRVLPSSYYSLFEKRRINAINHNQMLSDLYVRSYEKVSSKFENQGFEYITVRLPFAATLEILMNDVTGRWYGDKGFDYKSMKGTGTFIVGDHSAEVIVIGYLNENNFIGPIRVFTKREDSGRTSSKYLSTNMDINGPTGYTYVRLVEDSISLLFDQDDGVMKDWCYTWSQGGVMGAGKCKGCNIFTGDMSNLNRVDSSELYSSTMRVGLEFKYNTNTAMVYDCYVISPSVNLLHDKKYVESLKFELPSGVESNMDKINYVRQHLLAQIESFSSNHAYVYNYKKILECLDR